MAIDKNHSRELIGLSIPIIASRIVNLLADVINGLLIAHLGISALASYTLGISTFSTFYLICVSLLFSIGIAISRAFSAKQDMSTVIGGGFLLSTLIAFIFMIALWMSPDILLLFRQDSNVVVSVTPYFNALIYGVFPTLWGIVLSQYQMGIRRPQIVTWVSLITLPINVFIAYLLIFNKLGLHSSTENIAGAGYANSITAWLRFFIMLFILCYYENSLNILKASLTFTKKHITSLKYLYKFGWPLAVQYGGEVAILTIATYFIGHLDYRYLASQQVSSQFRLISMMIPFGIAQASSVMIAREVATGNLVQAHRNAFLAIKLGLSIMVVSSLICVVFANTIISFYISNNAINQNIINIAKYLLYIAAASQLFDTVKIILGGVLRGYGDTKVPMVLGLFALGIVGLPLSYLLGYQTNWGVLGIAIGVFIGFIASAILLLNRFISKSQNLQSEKKVLVSSSIRN